MARVVSLKKAKSAAVSVDGREELVEIAADLFAARGFAGTSIRDIADVAGRSVSNIYHYFENKEALWFAIFERSIKALPGQLREAIDGVEEPRERFIALVRGHLDITEHYRREAKMFFIDEERLSPAGNRINKRVQRDILSIYVAEIEGLRNAGLLASGDVQIAALNTLGAINWYLRWSRAGMSSPKRAEVVDQVLQFILRGVGCVLKKFNSAEVPPKLGATKRSKSRP